MNMVRRLSVSRRLARLEAAQQRHTNSADPEAWVELCAGRSVETHVVLTSDAEDGRWYFQKLPGPGKQLADFGKFSMVMELTTDEMNF
jgi:hypothetical protein